MRFAYSDPPYLGCGKLYERHHTEALAWDDPETHRQLIARLCDEYRDGWALSASAPSLATILPMCPEKARVAVWCKSFASFKPNVNPAYTWEPVIFVGGRKRTREEYTVRDHLECPITLQKGLVGAKPPQVCAWIIDLLNAIPGDEFDDLFPGTGAFTEAWKHRNGELRFARSAPK